MATSSHAKWLRSRMSAMRVVGWGSLQMSMVARSSARALGKMIALMAWEVMNCLTGGGVIGGVGVGG